MTQYVVLRKTTDLAYEEWDYSVEARSADEAIEASVPSARNMTGGLREHEVWVAVPVRHWQPAPVEVEETVSVRVLRGAAVLPPAEETETT